MYILTINNKEQVTAHDKTLITFLRDDLRLTGTKDIRGADRVLVDGVPTAARDVRVSALRCRHITTREGADEAMLQLHSLGDPRQYADDINVPRQVYVRPIFGCPGYLYFAGCAATLRRGSPGHLFCHQPVGQPNGDRRKSSTLSIVTALASNRRSHGSLRFCGNIWHDDAGPNIRSSGRRFFRRPLCWVIFTLLCAFRSPLRYLRRH